MNNNKKPGWKSFLSNRTTSELMRIAFIFQCLALVCQVIALILTVVRLTL